MRGVLGAFYCHPWAWNEIGYGGPAYPRGYMRLGEGQREPHQAAEAGDEDPARAVEEAGSDERRQRATWAPDPASRRLLAKGSRGPLENDSRVPARSATAAGCRTCRGWRATATMTRSTWSSSAPARAAATLAQRLARRGWRVVVLESGPFWDPDRDWVSDEAGLEQAVLDRARA